MTKKISRRSVLAAAVVVPLVAKASIAPPIEVDDQPATFFYSPQYLPDADGVCHPSGVFPSRAAIERYDYSDGNKAKRERFAPLDNPKRFLIVDVFGVPGKYSLCGVREPMYQPPIPSPQSLIEVPAKFEARGDFFCERDIVDLGSRSETLSECAARNAMLLASRNPADRMKWNVVAELGMPFDKGSLHVEVSEEGCWQATKSAYFPVRVLRPSKAELEKYAI